MVQKPTEEIYHTYKAMIFNYFYKATLQHHTAEDLTEETFLKVFKYFVNFRGECSVKTWLFRIARNTLLTYLKSSSYQEDHISDHEAQYHRDEYSTLEDRMVIRMVLSKLTEEERSLIVLRDISGFTYAEIANIMNYTEGQVRVGLHRARNKFKKYYVEECGV
jgi:RNA polymerase sigma-70 factor, ECF subfamily